MAQRITASLDFIFQKIAQGKPDKLDAPGQRVAARNWYRTAAQEVKNIDAVRAMSRASKERRVTSITPMRIGKMFMFWYDAKLKDELPYWDRLPLVFPIEIYKDGFLGINLHYLSPMLRAKLMDALYTTINNRRYDETTKLRINYAILKSAAKFRGFKPCVKRYLTSHVQSQFITIEPTEWDMALMLPTERFVKKRKQTVQAESAASLKGNV
jgi:hypothetical protein